MGTEGKETQASDPRLKRTFPRTLSTLPQPPSRHCGGTVKQNNKVGKLKIKMDNVKMW